MSSIPEESYRFEHLMVALSSPGCADPDDLLPGTSTEWEYIDTAFGFVIAIVGMPDQIEDRMMLDNEMNRRGIEEKIEVPAWLSLEMSYLAKYPSKPILFYSKGPVAIFTTGLAERENQDLCRCTKRR